ncbi:MAG: ABC transporter substrate-binding protein [Deltaproteobacteria bacterium]|jgi:branched-chain amino acid transport system substrate-binding protein
MNIIRYAIALILIATAVPTVQIAAADAVKIGVILPLTGRHARFGHVQQKAVLMAAGEINAGGGINGKKIEPIIADTKGQPDAGRAAIEKLINRDNVGVVAGGFSSPATWATCSVAQQKRIPFVVTGAAADRITEQGWEYIFRLNQPVSERLDAVAAFISAVASDIRSFAIVYANSLGHAADARQFFKKAGELGLKPVIRQLFETGTADFRPLLDRMKAKNPDLIYAVADNSEDAALLVRQLKDLQLHPKLFVGDGNSFVQPEFSAHAGQAAEHIVSTAVWIPAVPHRRAEAFNQKFIVKYRTRPEHYGAAAYAGITVIADALKRAKVPVPKNIRDALAKTNLMTVLGPVKFVSYNNKSQQNKLPALLVQWIDGQLHIVWPKHLATKKYVYPLPQ